MKINIEHGIANKIYRAFSAFMPLKGASHRPLTLEVLAHRYARGNVKMQMGKIMSNSEYLAQRDKVLKHDFVRI